MMPHVTSKAASHMRAYVSCVSLFAAGHHEECCDKW